MKVECVKKNIQEAISQAERVTGKNLTLPILSSIFLTVKENVLILRSTNLDIGIEIEVPVKVLEEGEVAVPGSVLNNLLSHIGEKEKITFESKNNNLEIVSSKNKNLIKCFPPKDFPNLPTIKEGKEFSIDSDKLLQGIKSVAYSASVSDIKPELSSVYIYHEGNNLIFVATDSFRLAEKKIFEKNISDFPGILIPVKNTLEMTRLLEQKKEKVTVTHSKNQISLTFGNIYFTSRIIDGVFPDYKQIIPKQYNTEAIVLKEDIMQAFKITGVFSNKLNEAFIKIFPFKKIFEIQTENEDYGQSTTYIDGSFSGNDLEIYFNYKYIVDCFQSIKQDSVTLEFEDKTKPIVVKGVGDDSFLYLVMPMNR